MKIGIIGGTGGMGEGFALRWCSRHEVIIGSRDIQKAMKAAESYTTLALKAYHSSSLESIKGDDNFSLAAYSDLLILSIPYEFIADTCSKLAEVIRNNCIVVSPIVPMTRNESGFVYTPLEQRTKTAAELVAENLPPRSRIISAFHTISEVKLKDTSKSLDADTFVCGDDENNIHVVNNLISEIIGLRAIYLGPLAMTYQAEVLTPMLLNAAKKNKLKNPAIKLV
jgi:NADPH-dependent F420 reductase